MTRKALIIGTGSVGQRHIKNLMRVAPETNLLVCRSGVGPDVPLLREIGARVFYNIDEALAERPDFVIIANPNRLHMPAAIKAAKCGCHLLIEKPLSDTWDGVPDLLSEVRTKNLVTLVGFNLRFHQGLKLVKSFVEGGRIGRLLAIHAQVGQYLPDWHPWADYRKGYSARRDLGGGVIMDLIHELDYVRWVAGEVYQVACMAGQVSDLEIDTEDIAGILLRFKGGAIGSIHMDYLQRTPSRICRIIGQEGTIVWDYYGDEVRIFEVGSTGWQVYRQEGFKRNHSFVEEMRHFLACLDGREVPVVDAVGGAEVLRLALASLEAARSGRVVNIKSKTTG